MALEIFKELFSGKSLRNSPKMTMASARNASWVAEHHIAHPSGADPGGNTAYTTPMWRGARKCAPGWCCRVRWGEAGPGEVGTRNWFCFETVFHLRIYSVNNDCFM